MGRIPKRELDRLKRELPLSTLLQPRITLKPRGKDLVANCPFHEDHTASLVVTESKGLWHCFGCHAGGTAIDWVMRTAGLSFRDAADKLLSTLSDPNDPRVKFNFDAKMSDAALMNTVATTYHEQLLQTPEALAYATKERGLSIDVIRTQRIGLAMRNPSLLSRVRKEDKETAKERLQALGLVRITGFEHLARCLTIPLFDANADVVSFYGRRATPSSNGGPKHLYLPGPRQGHLRGALGADVILCEALIDALTFHSHDFESVASSFGCEGFTDEHLARMKAANTKRVFIAYDHDDAGDTAADKLAKHLEGEGMLCARVLLPRQLDVNAYALKMTPAKKALQMALDTAKPYSASKGDFFSPNDVEDKAAANEVARAPVNAGPPQEPPQELPPLAAEETTESAAAAPAPVKKAVEVEETNEDEATLKTMGLVFRVRGLSKLTANDALKVNVLVRNGELFHVDTFDLYAAKARAFFVATAAKELEVPANDIKRATGRVILALEEHRAERAAGGEDEREPMSEEEREAALNLLRSPDLLTQIEQDLSTCGLVGEANNKLITYLASTSRKSDRPLAVMVQSSSAAGKSSLMESVLNFIPDEDKIQFSAMTGQSLFYLGEMELKHKVLAIAEEEGAEQASYALKLLQSEGRLRIASTGKDSASGRHTTHTYEVEGPVAILSTTTAFDVDEELLNRCIVLCVDEGKAQTFAIRELQQEMEMVGRIAVKKKRDELTQLHQNAQRLLEPVEVINPHAKSISFGGTRTRSRRDYMKLLGLIRTIAFVCQHQREHKTTEDGTVYVEATLEDVKTAERLLGSLLRSTMDELPPQTRVVFEAVQAFVNERGVTEELEPTQVHFTRRQLRESTGLGDTQLKVHLGRLVDLEMLIARKQGHRSVFFYCLALPLASEDEAETSKGGSNTDSGRGAVGGRSAERPTAEHLENVNERMVFAPPVGLLRSTTTVQKATEAELVTSSPASRMNGVAK